MLLDVRKILIGGSLVCENITEAISEIPLGLQTMRPLSEKYHSIMVWWGKIFKEEN